MISGARPGSIPGAQLAPSPKLEVVLGHEPLTLRRYGFGQVPQQKFLSHGRGGEPDPRLHRRIEIGKLRPKSRFPNVVLHRTSFAICLDKCDAFIW
jgi:hypothetical protein